MIHDCFYGTADTPLRQAWLRGSCSHADRLALRNRDVLSHARLVRERLRVPISQGTLAVSPRIIMNSAG